MNNRSISITTILFLICMFTISVMAKNINYSQFYPLLKKNPTLKEQLRGKNFTKFTRFGKSPRIYQQLNEVLTEKWVAGIRAWENLAKTDLKYQNDLVVEEKTYQWLSGDWKDSLKVTVTYDNNENVTAILTEKWVEDSAKWIELEKIEATYDPSSGYTTVILLKQNFAYIYGLTDVDPGLHDLEKDAYTYNTDGTVQEIFIQAAFPEDDPPVTELEDFLKILFTYDSDLNVTEVLYKLYFIITWVDVQKTENTYQNGKLVESVDLLMNVETEEWDNFYQYILTYTDFDSLESEKLATWDTVNTKWVDTIRVTLEYNADKLVEKDVFQEWIAPNWVNIDQFVYTYDNDLIIEALYQLWDNNDWANTERTTYKYSTGIHDKYSKNSSHNKFLENLHCINTQQHLIIKFTASQHAKASLLIYDVKGNLVASLIHDGKINKGINTIIWNRTNSNGIPIASGTYYYRLKLDDVTLTKQVIVTR